MRGSEGSRGCVDECCPSKIKGVNLVEGVLVKAVSLLIES